MATKNKRSLEDGYDMYNPAPFIENNPSFKYYVDNINPIYVDNNTGEVLAVRTRSKKNAWKNTRKHSCNKTFKRWSNFKLYSYRENA